MNKNTYIVIGVVAVALLLLAFGVARTPLGGTVHNFAENFVNGLVVGDTTGGGCIKIRDYDNTGWVYIYANDLSLVVTSSLTAPFTGACGGI